MRERATQCGVCQKWFAQTIPSGVAGRPAAYCSKKCANAADLARKREVRALRKAERIAAEMEEIETLRAIVNKVRWVIDSEPNAGIAVGLIHQIVNQENVPCSES